MFPLFEKLIIRHPFQKPGDLSIEEWLSMEGA